MARKRREWTFEEHIKGAETALRTNMTFEKQHEFYRERLRQPGGTPETIANVLSWSMEVVRSCEFDLLVIEKPKEAWPRLHLIWRYRALKRSVYLERAKQLATEMPDKARQGRLPIGKTEFQRFNAILMAMAFGAVLGEDKAAQWFGDRCVGIMTDRPPYVTPDAWNSGSVEQYLIRLYCIWRHINLDLASHGVTKFGPYQGVFEHWENDRELEATVEKLCRLHVGKIVNSDLPNDDFVFGLADGVNSEFPVEILFLQRVRRDLGLSIPNPEHPLLRSPVMQLPFPCPRSGYDEPIAEVYGLCKKMMPHLSIPWEEELQAAGPSDPRSVPPLEMT